MAPQQASTFNFSTSKRSACDRCRKQKLRCPSRASDAQPCTRCVRAGVECITGYTQPLGRSHRNSYASAICQNLSQSHTVPVVSQQQFEFRTIVQDLPSPPPVMKHADTQARQTTFSASPAVVASSLFFNEVREDDGSLAGPEMLDYVSAVQLLTDTCNSHPEYDTTNIDNYSRFLSLSPQFIETGEVAYNSESTTGNSTPSTVFTEDAFSRTLSSVDSDLRLSHLSMDMCRQAQNLKNMVLNGKDGGTPAVVDEALTELDTEPKPLNGCLDTFSQSKEFGDALSSTSEFMAIIKSKLDDISLEESATRHEAWYLMNLSCILNLISYYLLIVGVFEKLILRLHERMTLDISEARCLDLSKRSYQAGPQAFPGLHLGSFHVRQSSLQTKILLQIIEHQFEMIEKGLGLPVELRVSSLGRETCKGGLLQIGLDEALLQAVITRLCPIPGSLASLRKNIVKVRGLLDSH